MYKYIRSRRHMVTWACCSIVTPTHPHFRVLEGSKPVSYHTETALQHSSTPTSHYACTVADSKMRVPLARQVQIGGGEYLIDTILSIFGGGQEWQEQEAGNT
jgi:hypothetical protein